MKFEGICGHSGRCWRPPHERHTRRRSVPIGQPPSTKRALGRVIVGQLARPHRREAMNEEVSRRKGRVTNNATPTPASQVLYALNETYYLSEKTLEADLGFFSIWPDHFLERVYTLLGATGTTSAQLQESLAKTEALYNELATLGRAGGIAGSDCWSILSDKLLEDSSDGVTRARPGKKMFYLLSGKSKGRSACSGGQTTRRLPFCHCTIRIW